MPPGKTHITINWIVLVIINILIVVFYQDISIKHYFLFNIIFILTSYYISPDLDIKSSVYRRWKCFKCLWWPYQKIMNHRGLSHNIVFGPVSIFIYLGLLILPGILVILNFVSIDQISESMLDICGIITISIIVVCEIHILADKIF